MPKYEQYLDNCGSNSNSCHSYILLSGRQYTVHPNKCLFVKYLSRHKEAHIRRFMSQHVILCHDYMRLPTTHAYPLGFFLNRSEAAFRVIGFLLKIFIFKWGKRHATTENLKCHWASISPHNYLALYQCILTFFPAPLLIASANSVMISMINTSTITIDHTTHLVYTNYMQ